MTEITAADSTAPATVRLKPKGDHRVGRGHPWIYANEVEMTAEARTLPPGVPVRFENAKGELTGLGFFNPHSLICGRLLARNARSPVDGALLRERLQRALALRERLVGGRHYRLVHAEADDLPGLIVDRFGDVVVAQPNCAGIERLWPELEAALAELLDPAAIVVSGDDGTRRLEGLEPAHRLASGSLDGPIRVEENGLAFLADPLGGQKTGWFFDQRENRRHIAGFSAGARVLDAYCYTGGFALACARAGAAGVVALDRSAAALTLAEQAAGLNGLDACCRFRRSEVFQALPQMAHAGEAFEVVIADPPAFAKSRKDAPAALKGYAKLARLAAMVTAPRGLLMLCSCSHHVGPEAFRDAVAHGVRNAGREARIVHQAGAGPDHPVHPFLPESAYLKALILALD
ncbi:MAG TPA: class I SAM-dependent rRNA methyltransferase [Alphaproteobacteria bacterium]|nr:class I SAM-dependent rRNA methyltransferase [Alphaproteobacteria bacterium]